MQFIKFLKMNLATGNDEQPRKYFGDGAAGAIVYAKKDRMFLVLQRQKDTIDGWKRVREAGTWSLVVSGKIDADDPNPKETAKREFKEELRYKGQFTISNTPLNVFKDGDFTFTTYVITVDEIFAPKLNWEHSSYKWIKTLDDIPTPIHFGTKELFPKIKQKWKIK